MHDWYQAPAFALTALLLAAFAHLYWRSRDTRNLLWFSAFALVFLRECFLYPVRTWDVAHAGHPWLSALAQGSAILASGLFLASLSPVSFTIGRRRILYVFPYILPLTVYDVLVYGGFPKAGSAQILNWILPTLGAMAMFVGLLWDHAKRSMLPRRVAIGLSLALSSSAFWIYFHSGPFRPIAMAECGNYVVAGLLVISVFRRFSPGVVAASAGFILWGLPILLFVPDFHNSAVLVPLIRMITIVKILTGVGLLLLALENELAANIAGRKREHRARLEIEAYHGMVLSRRRLEEFDRQALEVCTTIVRYSRFSQCALMLLQNTGMFQIAGAAGFDSATLRALNALAARIPASGFLHPGELAPAVPGSETLLLDLHPWMIPGDDLERLQCTTVLATPMRGRTGVEGAVLLGQMHEAEAGDGLRPDDLVPIEMLTARLQSLRSQTRMLEKLIDSEKFAGLGQLAGNVTQQLNNPLTVVLGYASLLEDTPHLNPPERKAVDSILNAARSMRSTLESLHRVARAPGDFAAVSISDLVADMERLHRSEFLQRSIDFRVQIASDLPRVLCQEQQLRQAVLHCLQYAMDAVDKTAPDSERLVRLEATWEAEEVQVLIAHSGKGFEQPARAFEAFNPPHPGAGETAGLGLSLCATILRDNNGRASATNLEPQGAAMILELPAA